MANCQDPVRLAGFVGNRKREAGRRKGEIAGVADVETTQHKWGRRACPVSLLWVFGGHGLEP